MHIVVVADHARINGGQSKVAIESARGLASRGHRVTYFAAVGPADPSLAAAGIEVVCTGQGDISTTPAVPFLMQTLWNAKAAARLRALLASCDRRETVVHVHAWAKAVSPSIGPVLAACGLPCIYTMHEYFLMCPNGGFYDYQSHQVCHRVPGSLDCVTTHCDSRSYAHKLARVARAGLIALGGLARAFPDIIMISALQEETVRPYLAPGIRLHRVDNPIDVEDLGAKPAPGADFLFVGRVSPEKGVAHFCEAARLAGVRPVIVGDGEARGELERAYPEARFLGWKSPAEVRVLMREARALVFPSIWYEGQPLTVFEALALGTPVIVSDICAGREAVEPDHNGLWFRSGDAADLAQALTALSDEATAARMSADAYARYWARPLTLTRHVETVEAIYRDVLARAAA
jgi:glycosyltransferase involved in cell wall biosynthesis